jgi:hypothetical protein
MVYGASNQFVKNLEKAAKTKHHGQEWISTTW